MTNEKQRSRSAVSSGSGISPIVVTRVGPSTRVTPPVVTTRDMQLLQLIQRLFRVRRVFAEKTTNNVKLQRVCGPLYTQRYGHGGQCLLFPAACEPLIVQFCDALNLPYTLTGRRPSALALPAETTSLHDLNMLGTIADNDHVLVRHDRDAVDVAVLVLQICLAFPTLRMVILVKRVDDARRIAHLLRNRAVDVAIFTQKDRHHSCVARVAVTTYQHAGDECVGIWDTDVVIVENVVDAMSEHGRLAIQAAHRDHPTAPRIVGFVSMGFLPSINQAVELLNVYGPVQVLVPSHGAVVRQVEYAMLPIAGMNYTKGDGVGCSSVGEAKRALVWANPIRNRLIARVARGFAEGRVESVSKRFPELAEYMSDGKQQSVLVVVENGLHARALLHHHLRGWEAIGVDIGVLPPPAPRWGWPADKPLPAVATFAGLKTLHVANFDVVLRADAGTGALPLSKTALVTGVTDKPPLLLVDIDDFRDLVLASHTDKRRGAYDAAGWASDSGDHQHRELDRFLALHPQGNKLRKQIEQMSRQMAAAKIVV